MTEQGRDELARWLADAEDGRSDALGAVSAAEEAVAAAEAELQTARVALALAKSDLDAFEARVTRLRFELKSIPHVGPTAGSELGDSPRAVSDMDRTSAIVAVLRQEDREFSIQEVLDALHAAGRTDAYAVVVSTLRYLTTSGRIANPGRGRYRMA